MAIEGVEIAAVDHAAEILIEATAIAVAPTIKSPRMQSRLSLDRLNKSPVLAASRRPFRPEVSAGGRSPARVAPRPQ